LRFGLGFFVEALQSVFQLLAGNVRHVDLGPDLKCLRTRGLFLDKFLEDLLLNFPVKCWCDGAAAL